MKIASWAPRFSADAERAFSRVNNVKSKLRTAVSVQ